jgi:hypothetical protein
MATGLTSSGRAGGPAGFRNRSARWCQAAVTKPGVRIFPGWRPTRDCGTSACRPRAGARRQKSGESLTIGCRSVTRMSTLPRDGGQWTTPLLCVVDARLPSVISSWRDLDESARPGHQAAGSPRRLVSQRSGEIEGGVFSNACVVDVDVFRVWENSRATASPRDHSSLRLRLGERVGGPQRLQRVGGLIRGGPMRGLSHLLAHLHVSAPTV